MLQNLSRPFALLIAFLLACLACAALISPPLPEPLKPASKQTDLTLYQDIADGVAKGESYYSVATRLQRARGYPTQPFVTVRQPTLALVIATIGWPAARLLLGAIFFAASLAWLIRLKSATVLERSGVILALLAGTLMALQPNFLIMHETWAGAFACLCLALSPTRFWPWSVVAGLAAVAIRELAFPLIVIAAAGNFRDSSYIKKGVWLAAFVLFIVGLAMHANAVNAFVLAGDRAGPGWHGLRGPLAPLTDVVGGSLLALLPLKLGLIVAMCGLASLAAMPVRGAWQPFLYCLVVAALIAVFARPVNVYWFQLTQPMWLLGIPFVPRAIRDLALAVLAPTATDR